MNTEIIEVRGSIKLGQFLKLSGLAESGSNANLMIREKMVAVDGDISTQRGQHLKDGQIVRILDDSAPFQAQVKVLD